MRLTINGQPETIENASTVSELLRHFDVPPVRVAVEVNREIVTRSQYDETALHDGDTVEIVTFVGGG